MPSSNPNSSLKTSGNSCSKVPCWVHGNGAHFMRYWMSANNCSTCKLHLLLAVECHHTGVGWWLMTAMGMAKLLLVQCQQNGWQFCSCVNFNFNVHSIDSQHCSQFLWAWSAGLVYKHMVVIKFFTTRVAKMSVGCIRVTFTIGVLSLCLGWLGLADTQLCCIYGSVCSYRCRLLWFGQSCHSKEIMFAIQTVAVRINLEALHFHVNSFCSSWSLNYYCKSQPLCT